MRITTILDLVQMNPLLNNNPETATVAERLLIFVGGRYQKTSLPD